MNIHNINVIAGYEVKLLKRSWLFRIFSVLALLGISITIINMQTSLLPWTWHQEKWSKIALSSMMPFFCTYVYNIIQSIIVIFLAGSFLKRDKKLDTAEVIYVRPMSNADYIIGKTWGILRVFIPLNIIMLLITAFLNVVINHSPFSIYPYLFYLFTISIPSLLFVLGLSYTLTCLLKNQAVTLIVMLGIIGTTFFYLENTLYGVFDFFGVSTPSIFSDVTGLGNASLFLLQRSIYLIAGIGLITFTISLVRRLPQRPWKTIIVNIIGSVLLIIGCCAGGIYVFHFRQVSDLREKYINIYGEYASQGKVHILSQDITLEQNGKELNVESVMKIRNNQNSKLDHILFYLNPSLKITSIETEGTPLTFKQNEQVCIVDKSIEPEEELSLTMIYHGGINENICYADIKEDEFFDTKVPNKYHRFGKRYAWVEKDYTLLTPECLWYPVSIPPVNPQAPYNIGKNFSNYTLTVINPDKKVILSQGKSTESEEKITFTNTTPLTGISVTMGNYEIKSATMDSTSYEIYYFKGHDFFTDKFKEISDTLPSLLANHKNNLESSFGRDYPFNKIVLAETPVQFATYVRNWKGYTENIQPEIIFIPERMVTIDFDFDVMKGHVKGSGGRRNEAEKSELEQETQLLDWFLGSVFKNETASGSGGWENQIVNRFYVHPLFFGHVNFIRSEEFPIFDVAFNTMQNSSTQMRSWGQVINNQQRANLYLENHSFKGAMEDAEIKSEIFYELLKLKSNIFKNYIYSQIPQEAFQEFLKSFALEYSFIEVPFETLSDAIYDEFGLDLSEFISKWYNEDHSPELHIRNVDANQVVIEDITRYQVKFKINNPSDVNAIITAQTREGGGGGRRGGGGGSSSEPYNYVIPAGSAREIKIITDDRPSGLAINTNISKNLPTLYAYNFSKITTTISDTLRGIFPIDTAGFSVKTNDIIIDNEDPGFRTISSNTRHKLKDFFKKEDKDKYRNFYPWATNTQWKAYASDAYYGDIIHSAVSKRNGSGANSVEWTAEIPTSGYYEISIWNPKINHYRFSMGGRNNKDERIQTYTIKYDDKQENISLDLEQENAEWVSVGNFDLPKGSVTITLTDKVTGGYYVIADAVKFTEVKN